MFIVYLWYIYPIFIVYLWYVVDKEWVVRRVGYGMGNEFGLCDIMAEEVEWHYI